MEHITNLIKYFSLFLLRIARSMLREFKQKTTNGKLWFFDFMLLGFDLDS
ncbi:MAG: hypothetical protein BWY51_00191 [Parcubacteria group bacterium ADurb.Bin316]|nr:MAG: hypothetical protein BWY51_00191 [Parcubacteria group bacterium ADurb.Bin316]